MKGEIFTRAFSSCFPYNFCELLQHKLHKLHNFKGNLSLCHILFVEKRKSLHIIQIDDPNISKSQGLSLDSSFIEAKL